MLIEGVFVLPDFIKEQVIGAADLGKRQGSLVAGFFARSVHVLFQEGNPGILIRGIRSTKVIT